MDLEKAFDRVLKKVMEWALGKKRWVEVLVHALMSLLYMRIKGQKSELDQGYRKNLWYGMVCIKGLCYRL